MNRASRSRRRQPVSGRRRSFPNVPRRAEPGSPGVFVLDLEQLTGRPREHLEFTIWYLSQRKLVTRDDQSSLTITADGVDYVEQNHGASMKRRLTATNQT